MKRGENLAKKYTFEEITLDLDTVPALQAVGAMHDALGGITVTVKKLEKAWGDLGVRMGQAAVTATKDLEKTTQSAVKWVRALADFDQLDRVAGTGTKKSTKSTSQSSSGKSQSDTTQLTQVAQRLQDMMKPVLNLDLTPLKQSLQTATAAFSGFASYAGDAVNRLLTGVLVPCSSWITETMVPQIARSLSSAAGAVTGALTPVRAGLQDLFAQLQSAVGYVQTAVLTAMQSTAQALKSAAAGMQPVLSSMVQQWQWMFGQLDSAAGSFSTRVVSGFGNVTEFLSGLFIRQWEQIWNALERMAQVSVNMMIGFINTFLNAAVQGINRIVSGMNALKFTAPNWIPKIGGETFGFHMSGISLPEVPYLARGAVLPANRPFLAMVGDQRHGTNVEAPLSTIQEAVADVMQDQIGAMMAGFEASVQVQQQILEAVLGIRIGDDVIANACDRYYRKMAVMRGGF